MSLRDSIAKCAYRMIITPPPELNKLPPPKLVVSNHTGTFTINKLLKKTGSLLLQKHCQYTFHNFLSVFTDNPGKKFVDFLNFDTIPPSPPLYNVDDQVKTYANRHYL